MKAISTFEYLLRVEVMHNTRTSSAVAGTFLMVGWKVYCAILASVTFFSSHFCWLFLSSASL